MEPNFEGPEIIKIRQQLEKERKARFELVEELSKLAEFAANVSEAVYHLEKTNEGLKRTQEALKKVGELVLDVPHLRSTVVSLCSSVQVIVGPAIRVTGWRGLPKLRIYEEDCQIMIQLSDGGSSVSTAELNWTFDDSEILLPLVGLPGHATQFFLRILTPSSSNEMEFVAETQRIQVEELFNAQELVLPLKRFGIEVSDASLSVRYQENTKHESS